MLHGIRCTWGRLDSQSKIDRCLCSNEWFISFPDLRLEGLHRSFSDHNPLILSLEKYINWGPKPFRCFDSWVEHPEFRKLVSEEWNNLPNLSLYNKLKAFKGPLKSWSKDRYGLMDNNINKMEIEVHNLQKIGEQRNLDDVECARLRATQSHVKA